MVENEARVELDARFPEGWDYAATRADADKLYAGGITAVKLGGEVWPDDDDHDPDGDGRYLSREQAEACLKIVKEYIDEKYGPGHDPALYAPGHEGPFWNISLEGAEEWAIRIGGYDETPFPKGVFTEPVASWCLGLYPANN